MLGFKPPLFLAKSLLLSTICFWISPLAYSQQIAANLKGTWSGTFFSSQNFPAFTLTIVITPNSAGHLTGNSSLDSECLKSAKFDVTIQGSSVVFAGSDDEGDNLTLRGDVDSSGDVVNATYILNASATGHCETDNGTGDLEKR